MIELSRQAVGATASVHQLAHVIAGIPSSDLHAPVIDSCDPAVVIDISYVDDVVAPAAWLAHAGVIVGACEQFTAEYGPRFAVGPKISAVRGPVGLDAIVTELEFPKYFHAELPTVAT